MIKPHDSADVTHQEMEHGEELARWHEHMVSEPAEDVLGKFTQINILDLPGYDRVMHHWLIWLVLEV
jgi:hypothetical protein